ncbi:MAG: rod shape-determining protein MreD [Candidatus Omnitrophota bacterium]
MEITRGKRVLMYIVICALFLIEVVLRDRISILGQRPELLLIITLFFGLQFGVSGGIEAGLVSGLLKDVFSITGLGISTFSFFILGFLSGYLKEKLFKESVITQCFLSILAVYLFSGIYALYLSGIVENNLNADFWNVILYKALYTGFVTPAFFFIFSHIFKTREMYSDYVYKAR